MENDWKAYPENLPEKSGEYLITRQGSNRVQIVEFDTHFKLYDENNHKFYGPAWVDEQNGGTYKDVIAFMELPKVYQK